MQIKVKAEDGILISNSAKSVWADSATAAVGTATLLPTSAAAVASPAFVSANSTNADEAQGGQATANYSALSLAWSVSAKSEGVGYVDANTNTTFDDGEKAYVLLNNFYVKSSGGVIAQQSSETLLYINDVSASVESPATFKKVDNSLRILVVVNTNAFVYAPVKDQAEGTTTMSYTWKGTTAVTALAPTAYDQACTSVTSISNEDASAVNVKIYCYFEGEDANCKSTNISGITMNDINVTVNFGSVQKHA